VEVRDPFPASAPSATEVKRRLSGEELIADLFETMHALDFCRDSLEAGAFTLQIAMQRLGSAAGMVHLYDIDRREFMVVHARGPAADALRGLRTSDGDPLVAEVMRTHGALVVHDAATDPRVTGRRWDTLRAAGAPPRPIASVAAARVVQSGRFLGLLELANFADAGRFAPGDEHALAYIAERFMEFVAEHGVTVGVEGT
jgi:GAF domain-containing protein